ncbi:MAG: recombination protein [Chthoniobacteraceae bacterium]|nr:recombination protein [Chthoniobacteraceae bacterium]
MILYGRNGTGKSSLTDAWEWLSAGKVAHLAREGAEESSYPHMNAQLGGTHAEVEFINPNLGTVGPTFNSKKLRTPTPKGKLIKFRKMVSHPCHVAALEKNRWS